MPLSCPLLGKYPRHRRISAEPDPAALIDIRWLYWRDEVLEVLPSLICLCSVEGVDSAGGRKDRSIFLHECQHCWLY